MSQIQQIKNIITQLEDVKARPHDHLVRDLVSMDGYLAGYMDTCESLGLELDHEVLVEVYKDMGWDVLNTTVEAYMASNNFTELEVVVKSLEIHIEAWRRILVNK